MRKWYEAIDAVSGLIRTSWMEVYDLSAIEFLTYIKFYNYKVRKEEAQRQQFINQSKKR